MVRPTFGLFNHIRKKSILRIPAEAGMISRWQSTPAKGFCFACDRQHKSWKNTESQYRQGRCPGALRYCSPLEVSAIMFHIKKKENPCVLLVQGGGGGWKTSLWAILQGRFQISDFPEMDVHLFDWWHLTHNVTAQLCSHQLL